MNLEKLKQLLENGAISQDEFDELAKNYQAEESGEKNQEESQQEEQREENQDIDALISKAVQRAVDKVANKLGNENKKLREKLKEEQKKNLSAEELKKLEMEEKERELQEKEQALKEESNRLYAIKALKKAKLDDGSEDSLDLLELVMGENEESIETKVKALELYVRKVEEKKVNSIYKQNGRSPQRGKENSFNNPYKTGNLTEQMKLELENPELAKQLKASAVQ